MDKLFLYISLFLIGFIVILIFGVIVFRDNNIIKAGKFINY